MLKGLILRHQADHWLGEQARTRYTRNVKEIAQLLNDMSDAGVIEDYALFGAMAQMRYTEPVATLDANVLVAVPSPEKLDVLSPLYRFCEERGFLAEDATIRVGAWPVQFIPAFSELTSDAMAHADSVDFEGVTLRVVRADYLAVIALSVGRAKDWTRILSLLESGSVTQDEIATLASRYNLSAAWQTFHKRFMSD